MTGYSVVGWVPRSQPFDNVGKAKFVVGDGYEVLGMRFQAEPAIDGDRDMAWFKKIA